MDLLLTNLHHPERANSYTSIPGLSHMALPILAVRKYRMN